MWGWPSATLFTALDGDALRLERYEPMTSPVERISGRAAVDAGEAREREHGFLHRDVLAGDRACAEVEARSFSPAMTLAAMAAIGRPMALATKGTVREARGLTSST
jgi:hypothetical protein